MALKIGQRVMVKPGVSHCKDEGSLQESRRKGAGETGISRDHLVSMRGEIIQIGKDGSCTCPPGYEECYLVDSHTVNGKEQGAYTLRDWFREEELELG